MQRLPLALQQIQFARDYTLRLLDQTDPQTWFCHPQGGVTHIAWQVGHLAMADYRLLLERIRGARPQDETLISTEFLKLFGKQSVPSADASLYPAAEEIRATFDRVRKQALVELHDLQDSDLDIEPVKPHSLFNTKLGSLLWSANHEMMHAGQIGLLRRLHGCQPLW
jgi:hypothetical protein